MILKDMVEMGEAGAVVFEYNPLEDQLIVHWAPNGVGGLVWVSQKFRPHDIVEPLYKLSDQIPPKQLMVANLTAIRMELADGKYNLIGLQIEPTIQFLLIKKNGPEGWKLVEFEKP